MTSHDLELVILVLHTVATSITFSSTSFRRTKTANGTSTCGLGNPNHVLNLTATSDEWSLSLSSSSPNDCVPPETRCAFNCMQMNGCTSYNYRTNVNQCEFFFNTTMSCFHIDACSHFEVKSHQSCLAPVDNWIVIQERRNNSLNFTKNWEQYKSGFGTPGTNYWMGLEFVHQITNNGTWKLRMEMLFVKDNTWRYAEYASFVIDSKIKKYALHVGNYSGTAGDCLNSGIETKIHNGANFSTYDNENDNSDNNDCAKRYKSGWWYDNCYWVGLNLPYNVYFQCYLDMYQDWMLLKQSRMKIQPV